MKNIFKSFFVLIIFVASSLAQAQSPPQNALEVTFENGIHLRIRMKQTPSGNQNLFAGELAVKNSDVVHRIFTDARNRLGFGYDVDATLKQGTEEITIHVRPLDKSVLSLLNEQKVLLNPNAGGAFPTFQKERNVGPVHAGDVVSIDVLTNPSTGDNITDLIEVVSVGNPVQLDSHVTTTHEPVFHLADLQISVNGKEITARRKLQSVSGPFPVIYVPGYGSYFIASEPYKGLNFVQAGMVTKNNLQFSLEGNVIECISSTPILNAAGSTKIWIWHEKKYQPSIPAITAFVGRQRDDEPQIAVADSIDVWRQLVGSKGEPF